MLDFLLVGFMDNQQAIDHLRMACVPANQDPAVLTAEWQGAIAALGAAVADAGNPEILPIPAANQPHINQLIAAPWAAAHLAQLLAQGATFQLIEADKLLAYQFAADRAATHCGHLNNPTVDDLLPVCLQINESPLDFTHSIVDNQSKSVIVMTRNTNLNMREWGLFGIRTPAGTDSRVAGAQILMNFPFVHVVRFNGRCYLHNGFHRVYGARIAGATHVPCILRDIGNAAEIGLGPNTFQLPLLEGANPPTVGHFTLGRAHNVRLRAASRIIHVSWAEYTMPIE